MTAVSLVYNNFVHSIYCNSEDDYCVETRQLFSVCFIKMDSNNVRFFGDLQENVLPVFRRVENLSRKKLKAINSIVFNKTCLKYIDNKKKKIVLSPI